MASFGTTPQPWANPKFSMVTVFKDKTKTVVSYKIVEMILMEKLNGS